MDKPCPPTDPDARVFSSVRFDGLFLLLYFYLFHDGMIVGFESGFS